MATANIVTSDVLAPEFEIGETVPDKITVRTDEQTVLRDPVTGELSSPVTTLTYDNVNDQLTYTDEAGTPTVIDLNALTSDVNIVGGSLDPATNVLTLTDNDPVTPDVVIDLSELLGVSADPGNLLTEGADGKAFLDCAAVVDNCMDAEICDAFGVPLFNAASL